MNTDRKVAGHKTLRAADGSLYHEPLYEDEAKEILRRCDEEKERHQQLMPDEESAIQMFFSAWIRLKDFGWNDAIYCPKDRSTFLAIETGSTGQHRCHYEGEWPKGQWWIEDDGDLCPSHPTLYKPLLKDSP